MYWYLLFSLEYIVLVVMVQYVAMSTGNRCTTRSYKYW